jgi:hypothetical protein
MIQAAIAESLFLYRLWLHWASTAVQMGHVVANSLEAELRAVERDAA